MFAFLQSYFLYGLLAVSLPVLIHLLNRRKATRVQFSTLFFIRELQKKQMRRLKLRQLILLLLRALVIAMAVMAFARPTIRSSSFFLGKANVRTAAAIVLDNSMSMRCRVQFSTLFFIRELQKKQMRRLKLRQLILLLLRALVIAMAVMAFARPTIRSSSFFLGKANVRTAAAIVLDNSMSMRWEGPTGTRYSSAIKSINVILNQLNQGDKISLFVPCPIGDLSPEQTFETTDAILNLLKNSQASMLYGDMFQTMNQAAAHLNSSIFPNKEMYILSDFQKNSWNFKNPNDTSLQDSEIRYFTQNRPNRVHLEKCFCFFHSILLQN